MSQITFSPSIVNIRVISISATNGIAGETFTLECSTDITPKPLPQKVPFPYFEWFFGPTNASLPSGVTVSDVTNSGNTYTSTLQFSPLLVSHAGMYTCHLGGNERLSASTTVNVNG